MQYPNIEKFIDDSLINEEELISRNTKKIALTNILVQIDKARKSTNNKKIVDKLNSLKMVVDDMYIIDMYKFQFKAASENILGDLEKLKGMIANEV